MNRVTVVIGTYNGSKLLGPTLKSLEIQQNSSFDVAICDDASTDGSFEFLSEWAMSARLEVFLSRNSINAGPSKTYERAAAATDSDFILILG